jgi:hypothetical protein
MQIKPSTRKDKRFMAIFKNGTITHFGAKGGTTYIDEGNKIKRSAYIARHRVNENWKDGYSAGALSRFILWGDYTSIDGNIASYKRMFDI